MKSITLTIFIFLSTNLFAQKPLIIEGEIVDAQNEPIPFATLSSKKTYTATTSDINGRFKLILSEKNISDTLIIKHISYENEQFYLTKNTFDSLKKIHLKTRSNEIGATNIVGYNAITFIKTAIENLDGNNKLDTYYLKGFYRQKHKENGKFVRLIEAFASIKEDILDRSNEKQKEQFLIQDIRRSNVYERNGDKHGDHFVDLMSEDPINYTQISFLNLNNIHNYDFRYLESKNATQVNIFFQNKAWNEPQNKSGNIIINKEDFAILSIEITSTKNTNHKTTNISNWKFQNGTYKANYTKIKNKYHCSESSKYYNHYVLNEQSSSIDFIVEEYFEWYAFEIFEEKTTNKKYSLLSNLYSLDYKYDLNFWNNIKLPKIDQKVYDDLNEFKDLNTQFIDD